MQILRGGRLRSALASVLLLSSAAQAKPNASGCVRNYESAQEHRQAGKWSESASLFRACSDPACPELVRQECVAWSLVVEREAERASRAPALVSGAPRATAPATEDATAQARRVVEPSPTTERRAPAPASEPKDSSRSLLLPAVLGGVGLVAISGFVYLGLKGNQERDSMAESCKPDCDSADVDSARLKLTLANVSLGVGIAALGAGAFFYFSRRSSGDRSAVHLRVTPLAGGVSTGLGLRF